MPGCIWMNRNYKIFDLKKKKKEGEGRHCHLKQNSIF